MAATCSLTAWNVFPVPIKPMPSWSQSRKFASSKKPASIRITISTEALYRVRISDTISADHLLDVVAIIAVPLAPPENCVHDLAFPNQLQRLKALDLLVRRIASLPLQSLVVIHHHRVQR